MAEKRQGTCSECTHDIIDWRDLKYWRNACGYWFLPPDAVLPGKPCCGLARYGLMEILFFSLVFGLLTAGSVTAACLIHWAFWIPVSMLSVLWLQVFYFFRDPTRRVPQETTALVSPADGTITHVEEVEEPDFPGNRALRISIFLSIFNVHINRMPRKGIVKAVRYFPGAFLDARDEQCAVRNEQLWVDLEDALTGRPMRIKQISGAVARRIVCWLKMGEGVERGARFGMIKFGSRTDLLLPPEDVAEVLVKVGDKVKGASTVLLRLKEQAK